MSQEVFDRILADPRFAELTASRDRFSWRLAAVVLIVFFSFVMTVAFRPDLLGSPIAEGFTWSIGLTAGVTINIFCFLMTGIYVARANTRFDALNRRIIEEASR